MYGSPRLKKKWTRKGRGKTRWYRTPWVRNFYRTGRLKEHWITPDEDTVNLWNDAHRITKPSDLYPPRTPPRSPEPVPGDMPVDDMEVDDMQGGNGSDVSEEL